MKARKPPPRSKPICRDLGQQIKRVRERKGMTQAKVCDLTGMRAAQVSRMESGYNMESQFYARTAYALGCRNALEMFRQEDPLTTKLMRVWASADDRTRDLAYRKFKVWLLED
jgi:transcriptional regulator with XRE-family HTH domain